MTCRDLRRASGNIRVNGRKIGTLKKRDDGTGSQFVPFGPVRTVVFDAKMASLAQMTRAVIGVGTARVNGTIAEKRYCRIEGFRRFA